jgi:hypothetical protein
LSAKWYFPILLSLFTAACSSADFGAAMSGFAAGMAEASAPATPVHRLPRLCKVSYETEYGWSREVVVEVEFLTGRQLNRATRSYTYDIYANYALIWFSQDDVAILKCEEFLYGVGEDFDNEDFRKLCQFRTSAEFVQVNSDSPRRWRVTGKDYFRYVDPRAER